MPVTFMKKHLVPCLITFVLFLSLSAKAVYQPPEYSVLPLGLYTDVLGVVHNGFNGGTNNFAASTATTFTQTVLITNNLPYQYTTNYPDTNKYDNLIGQFTYPPTQVTVTNPVVYTYFPLLQDVRNYSSFGVVWSYSLMGSGTSACTLNYDTSGDTVNWQTNAGSITLLANGTSKVTTNATINIGLFGWVRFTGISNTLNSAAGTNNIIQIILKPNQSGPPPMSNN
jgi:hypothetical protein